MSEATNQMTEVLENILQVPDTPTETEAVETTEEIPQEAIEAVEQTEEVEVEEADDDSDLLEFEETEETEETDEAEEQPDNLIPVKIDGNEEMWTLDQLKQSAAGQGYINKRMQEIASVEKNFKSEIEQLTLQRQQMLDFFNQAKDQGLQEPVPPSADLFDSDPIAYMQEKLKYDESKTQHDAKVTQMNELQTQQNAANEARLQEYTMNQAQLLTEKLPEIADPDKGEAIKKGIAETGEFYGFTAEELGSVRDHRYILAMHLSLIHI